MIRRYKSGDADGAQTPPILVDMDSNRFRSGFQKTQGIWIRVLKWLFKVPIEGALYPFRQLVRLREYARDAQAAGLTNFLPAPGGSLRYSVRVTGLTGPNPDGTMTLIEHLYASPPDVLARAWAVAAVN